MAFFKAIESRQAGRRSGIDITVQRLVALANLLPLPKRKPVAVTPGDQLLRTQLLDVFSIDLRQMHIAFGEHNFPILSHLHTFAQVVKKLELGDAAHHGVDPQAAAQPFAVRGHVHRRGQAHQGRTSGHAFHG